jgi:hypothetical protein
MLTALNDVCFWDKSGSTGGVPLLPLLTQSRHYTLQAANRLCARSRVPTLGCTFCHDVFLLRQASEREMTVMNPGYRRFFPAPRDAPPN